MGVQVSGCDHLKYWRATHRLDECSVILVNGYNHLKHWRATHNLDGCLAILVSGSDLLKHWLTIWMVVQPFRSVDLIFSNIGEQLTTWMSVQPFRSADLIISNTEEQLTTWMGVQPLRLVNLICQTLESNSHPRWVFSHSGQRIWSAEHWWATHILDRCSAILVSGSDLLNTGEQLTS